MNAEEIKKYIFQHVKKNKSCIQWAFYNIGQKYNIDTEKSYILSWYFCYDRTRGNGIGQHIHGEEAYYVNNFQERYCGLEIEFQEQGFENARQLLQEAQKDKSDVIIGYDTFYCPWNIAYEKRHIKHFCNITEVNQKDNTLVCRDSYVSEKEYLWNIKEAEKGYKNIRIIRHKMSQETLSYNEACRILKKAFTKQKVNAVQSFEHFIEDLKNTNRKEDIFDYTTLSLCTIIRKIRELCDIRFGIAYVLLSLDENELLYNKFYQSALLWQTFNMRLMKMYMTSQINDRAVFELIKIVEKCRDIELSIMEEIKE